MKRFLKSILILIFLLNLSCSSSENKDLEPTPDITTLKPLDLGLSVYWANKNLGATDIYDLGNLYIFGDIDESLSQKSEFPILTDKDGCISNTSQDVVKAVLGNGWRLPTAEELYELQGKLSWSFINQDGKIGQVGKINNQEIFLPCSYYDSSKQYYTVSYMSGTYFYMNGYGYYVDVLDCSSIGFGKVCTICGENRIGILPGKNKFYIRPVTDK